MYASGVVDRATQRERAERLTRGGEDVYVHNHPHGLPCVSWYMAWLDDARQAWESGYCVQLCPPDSDGEVDGG